jgi:hypothetical protein
MQNIAFFLYRFTERGTEIAVYDYAHYNEVMLGNKSYMLCFNNVYESASNMKRIDHQHPFKKFNKRFTILTIEKIEDIKEIIKKYSINVFYTLINESLTNFEFNNKEIWGNCRTVKHCVFDTRFPEGDIHLSISSKLNEENKTTIPVLPHMINNHPTKENLRKDLNIPESAIVFGRYGGSDTFNIEYAKESVSEIAESSPNKYFLFMNTPPFCELPNVIFLGLSLDMEYKRKFINTCDAFLHARNDGESFGLAVGEFAVCLKPIITCTECQFKTHIDILKDNAILYSSKEELNTILTNFSPSDHDMSTNGYLYYTPANVMKMFETIIC